MAMVGRKRNKHATSNETTATTTYENDYTPTYSDQPEHQEPAYVAPDPDPMHEIYSEVASYQNPPADTLPEPTLTPGQDTPTMTTSLDETTDTDTKTPAKRKRREAVVIGGTEGFSVVKKEAVVVDVQHRPRNNPYDDAVAESFKQKFYEKDADGNDNWVKFTTYPDAVEDQSRLIRSAGVYHGIGTRIKVGIAYKNDDGATVVDMYFRGQPKKQRKSAEKSEDQEHAEAS